MGLDYNKEDKFIFVLAEDLQVGDVVQDVPTNYRELTNMLPIHVTFFNKRSFNSVKLGMRIKDNYFDRTTTATKVFIKFV